MSLADRVTELTDEVVPVDGEAAEQARRRHDELAKPPGSLGELEVVGARLAAISGVCPPPAPVEPAVVVAAADHGIHARGVSRWPQEVTAHMVRLFCDGRAVVNQVAAAVGARVAVLDVGVIGAELDHPRLRRARIRPGTADLAAGPAMERDEACAALLAGAGLAEELAAAGVDLLVPGDMGIANTTASACLVAAFTGRDAASVTGPGAGADEAIVARKTGLVAAALDLHRPDPADPLGVLAAVGGLEHAALVGAMLAAAAEGLPVVLDGLTSGAAALVAAALTPAVASYLIAGHRSPEPGAAIALEHLGLRPLLDLGLRLGEGTGGLLAVPLVVAAARVLAGTAMISDLGG